MGLEFKREVWARNINLDVVEIEMALKAKGVDGATYGGRGDRKREGRPGQKRGQRKEPGREPRATEDGRDEEYVVSQNSREEEDGRKNEK